MDHLPADIMLTLVNRLPNWVRHDLGSKDAAARLRAEETLAAMIVSALGETAGKATCK